MPCPPTLETARLSLRPPRPADAETLFGAYTRDAAVARFMVWKPHGELAETQAFIAACIAGGARGTVLPYMLTLRSSTEVVGMLEARLHGHRVNIGYVLARAHWGQGLMSEAVTAFTTAALAAPGVFRVEASCDVDNTASARTLEKSGFVREGRLARYTVHPNLSPEPRDCWLYATTR